MNSQEMRLSPALVPAMAKGGHQHLSWREGVREGGREGGRMNSLHEDLEAGRRGIWFISAFLGTDRHLNRGFYHAGWSHFQLTLLIFPRQPIFLMLFSRLY